MSGTCSTYGRDAYNILAENPKRKYLGDLGVGGMVILIWISQKQGVMLWNVFICVRLL